MLGNTFVDIATEGTSFQRHTFNEWGKYEPKTILLKIDFDEEGNPLQISWGPLNRHRIEWNQVKIITWGLHSPALMNLEKHHKLEELKFFSIFCKRTVVDFEHGDIAKVDLWVTGLRFLLKQSLDDVDRFLRKIHKVPPTPLKLPNGESKMIRVPSSRIVKPKYETFQDLKEDNQRERDRHILNVGYSSEIVPGWLEPSDYEPLAIDHEDERINFLRKEMNYIHVELLKLRDRHEENSFVAESSSRNRMAELTSQLRKKQAELQALEAEIEHSSVCLNIFSTSIAYFIHYFSVFLLLVCTFPWTSILYCVIKDRGDRADFVSELFGKITIAFSFTLNICLLFGPFHFWNTTHHIDHHFIAEASAGVVAFTWLYIHARFCQGEQDNFSTQKWLLDLCCVQAPPDEFLSKDDEYGKLYFLRIASTLAFLVALSSGFVFALLLELFRISDSHSTLQLVAFGTAVCVVWFIILRVICQSLVYTFGDEDEESLHKPLLPSDNLFPPEIGFRGRQFTEKWNSSDQDTD